MAFLNSAALLNVGTDAVKTASANQVTQESQASGSDEFAQALRKQMQQNSKPVLPVANKAEAPKPSAPDKPQSSQPAGNTNTVKSDDGSAKAATNQQDEQTSAEAPASADTDNTQADAANVVAKEPAVNETPQERKKRLLAELAANDQPPAGISPWMQTMIAMRPAATGDVQPKAEVASDVTIETVAATVTDKPSLTETTENGLPLDNEAMTKTTSTPVPTGSPVATAGAQEDKGVDFKQLLADTPQASAGKESTGLPETMVNAKLMAESGQDAGRIASAFSETRSAETQTDILNLASQPAAQVLSNSQWLNAAGVNQASNVMMSQIAAPFGNERWQTAMNQHVMNMVSSGDDLASLTLSPPDLGPIQVVLKVDNQSVNTSFITDNPLVRQALEDGMQDLRDRMQSQGLQLGQTFVGDGQQAQQHFEQQTTRQGNASSVGATAESEAVAPQTAVKTTVARGLVDTFV